MSSDNSTASRLQRVVAATVLLGFALWIAHASFRVEDPQPYLFPQLISVALVGLACATLLRALRGAADSGKGFSLRQLVALAPAIALMLLYVFVLAPVLGYYTGAAITFFGLYTLYDPEPHSSLRSWGIRSAVTLGFISMIYVVFALGLQVQTPRGLFL
jgi:hypothetical protein